MDLGFELVFGFCIKFEFDFACRLTIFVSGCTNFETELDRKVCVTKSYQL